MDNYLILKFLKHFFFSFVVFGHLDFEVYSDSVSLLDNSLI